jgi:TRAP-type C4-dicarboxylate transport system permease small subunit
MKYELVCIGRLECYASHCETWPVSLGTLPVAEMEVDVGFSLLPLAFPRRQQRVCTGCIGSASVGCISYVLVVQEYELVV